MLKSTKINLFIMLFGLQILFEIISVLLFNLISIKFSDVNSYSIIATISVFLYYIIGSRVLVKYDKYYVKKALMCMVIIILTSYIVTIYIDCFFNNFFCFI